LLTNFNKLCLGQAGTQVLVKILFTWEKLHRNVYDLRFLVLWSLMLRCFRSWHRRVWYVGTNLAGEEGGGSYCHCP